MSNGSTTWSMTYNADGLRTKRTNGSTTYSYIYNGSSLSRMTVGSNTLYFAYDASGTPMSVTYNDTVYYYVTNIQGDITAILNTSGTAVVQYTYDAWGNVLTTTGPMASTLGIINPLRYRGYVYDTETGLYYLQSRYYDPEMGRFINADAFASTGQGLLGNNMFAYCNNNAVNFKDPDGKEPITATISLAVVIGALVITVVLAVAAYYTVQVLWEVAGWISESIQTALYEISYTKKATEPEPPDVTYPGDDPAKAPDGYEWRGPDEQGGKRGGYSNPNGKDSWHPDLDHPDGVDPHWDYNDGLGHKWRVYPKHIEFVP